MNKKSVNILISYVFHSVFIIMSFLMMQDDCARLLTLFLLLGGIYLISWIIGNRKKYMPWSVYVHFIVGVLVQILLNKSGIIPKDGGLCEGLGQFFYIVFLIGHALLLGLVNLILFFFIFSFIGYAYEVAIHLVKDGTFVNRGSFYGPWLPIYGFGGVLILALLKRFRDKPWKLFLAAFILCGVVEYTGSWILEITKHMKYWDYSGYFFNINGRVCLEGLLVFGLGGCGFTYILGPIFDNLCNKIKPKIKVIICCILVASFLVDMAISSKFPNAGKGITDYDDAKSLDETNVEIYN